MWTLILLWVFHIYNIYQNKPFLKLDILQFLPCGVMKMSYYASAYGKFGGSLIKGTYPGPVLHI